MAEWVICSSCQLKHSRRVSGICPRCQSPVDDAGPLDTIPAPAVPGVYEGPQTGASSLGSLAQSARGSQLKVARAILLFVGLITFGVNAVAFANAEANVEAAFGEELAKANTIGGGPFRVLQFRRGRYLEQVGRIVRSVRLATGGGALLGLVFIGCGLGVRRYPVPATVAGLVLYIGGSAIFLYIDPETNLRPVALVMKLIIVFALFKAVRAAVHYQKVSLGDE
jgi:hypothetical protein